MTTALNDLIVGPTTPSSGVSTISVDFYVSDETHVKVYKSGSETPLVLSTDYTFSGVGTSSGVVTLTTPANGTDSYAVYLEVPLERTSDMQLRGAFRSDPFNDELDRVWQAIQYIDTISNRTLRFSKNSANPAAITSEVAADRANKVLTFNASGDPIVATTLDAGSVVVTPFTETLLDDTTAANFLTTLGFTATLEELNQIDGATSNIQDQLNALSSGKEAADPEILKADTDDNVTAGYTATADDDGVKSSGTYTPDPAGGNLKRIVNGGAFTLAAPTAAGDYTIVVQMTNNASAGTITVSGFNRQAGDSFTATDGDDFFLFITKINGFTSLTVQALQ